MKFKIIILSKCSQTINNRYFIITFYIKCYKIFKLINSKRKQIRTRKLSGDGYGMQKDERKRLEKRTSGYNSYVHYLNWDDGFKAHMYIKTNQIV